ncbi:MAG TPA: NUDIX domain-containing protein [Sphingomicrobium sp.]|nr:NUDIX domain-containing protein [Sphingomicrobium sp.]
MSDEAIPAATLIVVRDRPAEPPELLMVERARSMAFAAGAWVFPGGRIDEQDRQLGSSSALHPGAVAAIRETLEETAIPVGISPVPSKSQARAMQKALIAGQPFAHVLEEGHLELDGSALIPFARWVPKFHAVRRFDTFFFVAPSAPGDWEPAVVEGECAQAAWLSAPEVLEREARGEARLIFPTRRNLERLAQHSSFAAIRNDAVSHPVEPISPWVEEREGEQFITIPGDLGYPITSERLEGLWRG